MPTEIVMDPLLRNVMVLVQIIGGIGMLIAIITSIWSLLLQKKEVIKQNQKIIDLLTNINEVLSK